MGADEKICRQFSKVCRRSGSRVVMTRHCSRNIRILFWGHLPEFKGVDMKFCEETAFEKMVDRKKQGILVDGAHIEGYITEVAHEITKMTRNNPGLKSEDPRVTITKHLLEKVIRETRILVTGKVERPDDQSDPKGNNFSGNNTSGYEFVRPEFPTAMRKVYDLRKSKAIVIAKRDYGNLS